MLTRRLLTSNTTSSLRRSLSTSTAHQRSPALADITPNNASVFEAKQREFREQTREAQRAKKEQDSQLQASLRTLRGGGSSSASSSSSSSSPTMGTGKGAQPQRQSVSEEGGRPDGSSSSAPSSSSSDTVSPDGVDGVGVGLGKLSIQDKTGLERESSTREAAASASKRGGGKLSNLIYGTKEGREMDQDIEKSFSQVLARGKYVHSIVTHDVKPDKVDEYVELVGKWYPRMAGIEGNHVHLVGSWRTEVGDCDTFVHIWEYQRYQGYHASLHSIASHPEFPDFDKHLKSLITAKNSSLMQEFSFWPTTPPRQLGGLFELRSYTLHPGNLLEWETHWRKGLKARKEVMEGVGAWFVQIGELNTVHHLWQFADLEERKARRELSWGVEGWADTVHKTVPLIQQMKSRVLVAMPWSPVG